MDGLLEKRKLAVLSEKRIEILKKLNGRRMTLSELSKELEISKSSVKEHLDKLIDAELVRRLDEGRKWIYYEITEKGRRILHEESRKLILMLILSVLSILMGILEVIVFSMAKISSPDLRAQRHIREFPEIAKVETLPLEIHLVIGLFLIALGSFFILRYGLLREVKIKIS